MKEEARDKFLLFFQQLENQYFNPFLIASLLIALPVLLCTEAVTLESNCNGYMTNQTIFFIRYYFIKHFGRLFGKKLSVDALFSKRFYRMANKVRGKVVHREADELIYEIKGTENSQNSFYIRTGASSDVLVFSQVFQSKEYEPLINEIQKRNREADIRFIIDAGANVGYTSVLLKQAFPAALLLAIEPDGGNAKQIRKNLTINKIENSEVLQAGLWSEECWLQLKKERGDGREWAYHVTPSLLPTELKAYSLSQLLQQHGFTTIDILKIDIEGSEAVLFNDELNMMEILKHTRFLAIEIHDEQANRQHIYTVLKNSNFSFFEQGELTIATNLSLL